jgi:hypothetical protein
MITAVFLSPNAYLTKVQVSRPSTWECTRRNRAASALLKGPTATINLNFHVIGFKVSKLAQQIMRPAVGAK